MKKIKNLAVTVTLTVGLEDIEVSNKEYNALQKCYERGLTIEGVAINNYKIADDALDWLDKNIDFSNAMNWSYEIDDLEEEETK